MHGTTQSRENKILPYTHFLITSDYRNKHRSTHQNHHKYHSHYVSSRTLLKLLDLLRQNVLSSCVPHKIQQLKTVISTFLLQNKARISASFPSQCHSISHIRSALTVHVDAHEHLGMSYTL